MGRLQGDPVSRIFVILGQKHLGFLDIFNEILRVYEFEFIEIHRLVESYYFITVKKTKVVGIFL